MGYTAAEFAKTLHGDFSNADSRYACQTLDTQRWRIEDRHSALQIEITINQSPPRQLGLLQLPVLQVDFAIVQSSPADEAAFYDKFFSYFHKGGG